MRPSLGFTGRHQGGRGFQGFHPGGPGGGGGFGHRNRTRGRKISSGDLQLLLLLLLEERPRHGYEAIKAIEQRSGGFYAPSPGMVYPALTYLEELGYATVSSVAARKLYELSPAGRSYLDQNRAAAQLVMEQLEQFGRSMFRDSDPGGDEPAAAERPGLAQPPSAHHAPRKALSLGPSVDAVLARLQAEAERRPARDGGPRRGAQRDPFRYADYGFSISQDQGELIYLLCRQMRARRVIDFATSVGVSAIYFAAAMRDNQDGLVIGSEIVPEKVRTAGRNLQQAGLDPWVNIREGDARQTLRELGEPIDFALIDGWPADEGPSLARGVVEIVAPQLRRGGLLLNDNAEPDYLEYVRDPSNGFVSISLPLKGGTELSLKR
jgi:predicted O-methyltransferase YrrM/DNA-binding PadR family transcriptional regulator